MDQYVQLISGICSDACWQNLLSFTAEDFIEEVIYQLASSAKSR